MALCGFGSVGGDTSETPCSSGRASRTASGPWGSLSLCSTPTFEMSNARLVGPDPVPNHSDWPARAVCAPRWFCRSEGVAGALPLSLWEKGCPGTPVLDLTVPAKRVGRRWLTTRGIPGSGGCTTPPLARTTRPPTSYVDWRFSFGRAAASISFPCEPRFSLGLQASGGSGSPPHALGF
jgi:hypothetical protein